MKLEDYNEYYIQGSDHYLIPKDIFDELFGEMINWKEENKQLKSQWCKLKEYLHNVNVVIDHSENYDGRFINYNELVNKMQEIEGSDSNVKD